MSPPIPPTRDDLWLDALSHLAAEHESPAEPLDEDTAARLSDALFLALENASEEDAEWPADLEREAELWQRVDAELEAARTSADRLSPVQPEPEREQRSWIERIKAFFAPQAGPQWAFAAALLVLLSALAYVWIREVPTPSHEPTKNAQESAPAIVSTPAALHQEEQEDPAPAVVKERQPAPLVIHVDEPLRSEEVVLVARAMTGAVARSALARVDMARSPSSPSKSKKNSTRRKAPKRMPLEQPPTEAPVLEEAQEEAITPKEEPKPPRRLDAIASDANMLASEQAQYFQRVSEGCRARAEENSAGRIVIDVHIDERGRVLKTAFVSRDLSLELARCLELRVKGWTFQDADKLNFQMVFKFRARVSP